jgi:hypothetical protein
VNVPGLVLVRGACEQREGDEAGVLRGLRGLVLDDERETQSGEDGGACGDACSADDRGALEDEILVFIHDRSNFFRILTTDAFFVTQDGFQSGTEIVQGLNSEELRDDRLIDSLDITLNIIIVESLCKLKLTIRHLHLLGLIQIILLPR